MVILYKDPKGEKIFDRGQSQGTLNLTAIEDTKVDNFNDLERHCKEMETRLGKYEVSIIMYLSFFNTDLPFYLILPYQVGSLLST